MMTSGKTRLLPAIGIFAAIVLSMLWSWNVLAELFGAPPAQLKHLLAATILILAMRVVVRPLHERRHYRGGIHDHWIG